MSGPAVVYVADSSLIAACDSIPAFRLRARVTHCLLAAYGLLGRVQMVASTAATEEELRQFHSEEYVTCLQTCHPDQDLQDLQDQFGLGYDCPVVEGLWGAVCRLAGATLTAARTLMAGRARVAINWCGGWHHAHRDAAAGFCYVNDIVLGVRQLLTKFDRVLYVDLDVHHGDGVEEAFQFSPRVVTFSLHQLEAGFFPGTGQQDQTGQGRGRHCSLNVPYRAGINDQQFIHLFESLLPRLCEVVAPGVVVCQCGADALAGDPLGGANLTSTAYKTCIQHLTSLNKPLLLLGGGGYNKVNAARLWTEVTASLVGAALDPDIPDHQYLPLYGPGYELEVTAGLRRSDNTQQALDHTIHTALENIERLAEVLRKKDLQRVYDQADPTVMGAPAGPLNTEQGLP